MSVQFYINYNTHFQPTEGQLKAIKPQTNSFGRGDNLAVYHATSVFQLFAVNRVYCPFW